MRKPFIIFFLSFLLTFMFGCDDRQEEIDALEAQLAGYTQYDELIGYIESDSFDQAKQLIDAYSLQHNNAQIQSGDKTSVSVSAENWKEYFDVVELTEWCEDDFGAPTGFITHVCIVLRDAYVDRLISEDSEIDFQWQARCSVKNCSVDIANRIVSIENVFGSKSTTFGDPEMLSGTVSFDGDFHSDHYLSEHNVVAKIGEIVVIGEYLLDGEKKPVCFDYEDVSVTQVQGVLMLHS